MLVETQLDDPQGNRPNVTPEEEEEEEEEEEGLSPPRSSWTKWIERPEG